jgi:very-short-patch-repair endonuclease
MGTQSAQPNVDRRLAAIARRQYGVVSHAQLRELGLSAHAIAERVRTARLHRLHRGVYAVGHDVLRREAIWLAAVLACGPGAVLSHLDAAALWGIRPKAAATVDVTIPSRAGRRRRHGIRIHRSGRLSPKELTVKDGIPVTTLARTLLDLADVLPDQPLKRAIDESEYRRLFDLNAVIAVVERNPGRRGAKLLALAGSPPELTREEFEPLLLGLVTRQNLPRPKVNTWVEGYEVDFLWAEQKLIVETDGLAAHGTRQALQNDRRRDRRLLRAGYRTIRLTRADFEDEAAIAADIAAELARRPL